MDATKRELPRRRRGRAFLQNILLRLTAIIEKYSDLSHAAISADCSTTCPSSARDAILHARSTSMSPGRPTYFATMYNLSCFLLIPRLPVLLYSPAISTPHTVTRSHDRTLYQHESFARWVGPIDHARELVNQMCGSWFLRCA